MTYCSEQTSKKCVCLSYYAYEWAMALLELMSISGNAPSAWWCFLFCSLRSCHTDIECGNVIFVSVCFKQFTKIHILSSGLILYNWHFHHVILSSSWHKPLKAGENSNVPFQWEWMTPYVNEWMNEWVIINDWMNGPFIEHCMNAFSIAFNYFITSFIKCFILKYRIINDLIFPEL